MNLLQNLKWIKKEIDFLFVSPFSRFIGCGWEKKPIFFFIRVQKEEEEEKETMAHRLWLSLIFTFLFFLLFSFFFFWRLFDFVKRLHRPSKNWQKKIFFKGKENGTKIKSNYWVNFFFTEFESTAASPSASSKFSIFLVLVTVLKKKRKEKCCSKIKKLKNIPQYQKKKKHFQVRKLEG